MRHFLIFLVCIIFNADVIAQKHCGSEDLHEKKKLLYPERYKQQQNFEEQITQIIGSKKASKLAAVEPIYTIPVVVHVVHNVLSGAITGTNIPNSRVLSQIQILNEDYRRKPGTNGFNTNPVGADANIEFCLATSDPNGNPTTGVIRTYNVKDTFFINATDEALLKSLSYWPSDQYLNIWVTTLEKGYLGYAQYASGASVPGLPPDDGASTDGVVIDYKAFGYTGPTGLSPYPKYNLGRTATHEVGHWLGLIHIWGDAVCGNDYVSDTPVDKNPNNDNDCADSSNCITSSVYTQDMTNNYLDYSVDACMNIFTIGQKTRMRTVIETSPRRKLLLSSKGCCANPNIVSVPFENDFETASIISNGWTAINLDSHTNVAWAINNNGGFGNSTSSVFMQNDSAELNEKDLLMSPPINFTGIEPYMEFDLAYALDPSLNTDTLIISYGSDCNTWTPLVVLFGNSLTTTSLVTSSFTPTSGDWKRIKINLSALANKPSIRIGFENHSSVKNNIYIDNINIYKYSCANSNTVSIPFKDDFETGSILSNAWTTESEDSNVTWAINNYGGFGNSAFSVYMQNDSASLNDADHLVTPILDFANIKPYMEFDLAYAQDPSLNTDTLIVSYTSNCDTWKPLLTLFGNSLITTPTITSNFTPGPGDWKRIKLDLSTLNNKSGIRISFDNYSSVKNNIYIDNVNIYKTSDRLFVRPYPNPAKESINIEVLFQEEHNIKFELYDAIGQKIFEINDYKQTSYIKTLDVSGLASGMYILKVSTETETVIKRILLNF